MTDEDQVLTEIASTNERLREAMHAADHAEQVVNSLLRRAELLKAKLAATADRRRSA
jgi:hypothetical protein